MSSISAGLSAPTNNVGGIIAATASPAVAHAIGDYFHNHDSEDSAAHLLAHAALGAAVAAAGGNNALVGAVSTAGGEAAAPALTHWLYGKDVDDLTTEEKQTISSIIGLAGASIGATTGNSADIVSGAQIGQNAVDNNYLSTHQQEQKEKELIQCDQSTWCKVKVHGKWLAVNGAQQASLSAGIVSGIPMPIGESLEELIHIATSPVETYKAIKSLINSGDILGNVSAVLKQEYSKRIDNLIAQYEKAGASGSYKAGVEIGKLLTDIGTIAAGGAGIGKGVVKGISKVVDKVADKLAHGIDISKIKFSQTVENHLNDINKAGNKIRPYGDSISLINEIIHSKPPVPDPQGIRGALRWDVEGKMNGSKGTYEVVIDPKTNTVIHFLFRSKK